MSGGTPDINKAIEESGFEAITKKDANVVPEQVGRRSEFYRVITPDIFMGGVKEGFIEMIALSARTNAIDYLLSNRQKTEMIEEINIKLSPQQAKKLTRWLLRNLILYEKAFGKTILLDELVPEMLANGQEIKSVDMEVNKKLNELVSEIQL